MQVVGHQRPRRVQRLCVQKPVQRSAEGRALTGVKTYDGYYLSFAEGYLCDEINHYSTLLTATRHNTSPAVTSIRRTLFSNPASPSRKSSAPPARERLLPSWKRGLYGLPCVGVVQSRPVHPQPGCTYNVQSILDAYRKDSYDNDTPKYDFSGEGEAVARMYESDQALVEKYNASLTEAETTPTARATAGCPPGWKTNTSSRRFSPTRKVYCALPACRMGSIWSWKRPCPKTCSRPTRCGHGGFCRPAERPVSARWLGHNRQQQLHDLQCAERRTRRVPAAHQDRRRNRQAGQDR